VDSQGSQPVEVNSLAKQAMSRRGGYVSPEDPTFERFQSEDPRIHEGIPLALKEDPRYGRALPPGGVGVRL